MDADVHTYVCVLVCIRTYNTSMRIRILGGYSVVGTYTETMYHTSIEKLLAR